MNAFRKEMNKINRRQTELQGNISIKRREEEYNENLSTRDKTLM